MLPAGFELWTLRLPGERSTHYTTGSDDIVFRKLGVKKKKEMKARG